MYDNAVGVMDFFVGRSSPRFVLSSFFISGLCIAVFFLPIVAANKLYDNQKMIHGPFAHPMASSHEDPSPLPELHSCFNLKSRRRRRR